MHTILQKYVPQGRTLCQFISEKGWNLHEHKQEIIPGTIDIALINPRPEYTPVIRKNYILIPELNGRSISEVMEQAFDCCPALVFSDFRIFRFSEIFFDSQYARLHGPRKQRMSLPYLKDNYLKVFQENFQIHRPYS